jgi:hypothetical protein
MVSKRIKDRDELDISRHPAVENTNTAKLENSFPFYEMYLKKQNETNEPMNTNEHQ